MQENSRDWLVLLFFGFGWIASLIGWRRSLRLNKRLLDLNRALLDLNREILERLTGEKKP